MSKILVVTECRQRPVSLVLVHAEERFLHLAAPRPRSDITGVAKFIIFSILVNAGWAIENNYPVSPDVTGKEKRFASIRNKNVIQKARNGTLFTKEPSISVSTATMAFQRPFSYIFLRQPRKHPDIIVLKVRSLYLLGNRGNTCLPI